MSQQVLAPLRHVNYGKKWIPESNEMQADFNVIHIPEENQQFRCTPYNRKGLFKISIHHGHSRVYYADKVVEVKNR